MAKGCHQAGESKWVEEIIKWFYGTNKLFVMLRGFQKCWLFGCVNCFDLL